METPLSSTSPLPCCSFRSKLICFSAGLVILIAVAVASFLLGRTSAKPSPLPQALPTPTISKPIQTIDTTNWKTYKNEFGKFSLKYPQSMNLSEKNLAAKSKRFFFSGPEGNLTIDVLSSSDYDFGMGGGCDPKNQTNLLFAGKMNWACGDETYITLTPVVNPDGTISFQITVSFAQPYQENKAILLQILSTFKFLE